MIIAICLMFGLIATGDLFAVVYFGDNYTETGYLLVVMSVTVPMIAWASVIRGTILNSEKIRQTVYFLGCGGRGLQHHAKSMGDSEVECAGRCIGDYSNRIARLRNAYCFS